MYDAKGGSGEKGSNKTLESETRDKMSLSVNEERSKLKHAFLN